MTESDAFRILLTRFAKGKVFPLEPLVPNKETIEAMKAARSGKLVTVGKITNLLDSCNNSRKKRGNCKNLMLDKE